MASPRRFSRSDKQKARKTFESRSPRAQAQDLIRMASIAPNIEVYLKTPERFDFPGIDTPDPKLIFSKKSPRERAADLARLASKAPLELWIKDTSQHDIQGVDTPIKGKKKQELTPKKFKVVKKEDADKRKKDEAKVHEELEKVAKTEKVKKELELQAEKIKKEDDDADSPIIGHKLPSHEEILAKATELFMKAQSKVEGLGETLPELSELQEAGYLRDAQLELMRDPGTGASEQVLQYIDSLKAELEPMGFSIVPL